MILQSLLAALSLNQNAQPIEPLQETQKPMEFISANHRKPAEGEEVAVMETGKGRIVLMFFADKAPLHVAQFKKLIGDKFYDGVRFHRCIADFMIQGGDPNTKDLTTSGFWGTGGYSVDGKKQTIKAEFNDIDHERGIWSTARSQDPDSASSQFFIMHNHSKHLNGQYTVFGKVVTGLEVVDEIVKTGVKEENGRVEPENAVQIKSVVLAKWPLAD